MVSEHGYIGVLRRLRPSGTRLYIEMDDSFSPVIFVYSMAFIRLVAQ